MPVGATVLAAAIGLVTYMNLGANPSDALPRMTARECRLSGAKQDPTSLPDDGALDGLDAELVADGLDSPTDMAPLPGSEFLLVTEKPGRVVAVVDGEVLDPPVLDIGHLVTDEWNEQGLLTIEIHPDFSNTCEVFLFFTDNDGDSNLVSVLVEGTTVPTIDIGSMRTILEVAQEHQYHQSGSMAFGPDGHLWISIGDGGLKHPERSQDPQTLEGSILRIDLNGSTYDIPQDNPFAVSSLGRGEVWSYGVRNPWRISIDSVSGQLYVPDTGGVSIEEINILPLSEGGQNLGWPVSEGDQCLEERTCAIEEMTLPVYSYDRDEGCAIVGGEVYRGTEIPELEGHYFFGDFCRAWVRSITFDEGRITSESNWPQLDKGSLLTSFATDSAGELYFTNLEGQLWRITPVR